jgi:hypothetical protein
MYIHIYTYREHRMSPMHSDCIALPHLHAFSARWRFAPTMYMYISTMYVYMVDVPLPYPPRALCYISLKTHKLSLVLGAIKRKCRM